MKYKLILLLIISGLLAGCVNKPEEQLLPTKNTTEITIVKYTENYDPILTQNDFPDFKLVDHKYFIVLENLSLTLQTESYHGAGIINASDGIPKEARLYGSGETYKSGDRYIIIQYKVFDSNEDLNDSMNLTVSGYTKAGFEPDILKNATANNKRIFVLESNVTNKSNVNVTIILFGYDTILGKIGVQDSKDKSLNESLKILDIVLDRLKIKSKEVTRDKNSMFVPRNL